MTGEAGVPAEWLAKRRPGFAMAAIVYVLGNDDTLRAVADRFG